MAHMKLINASKSCNLQHTYTCTRIDINKLHQKYIQQWCMIIQYISLTSTVQNNTDEAWKNYQRPFESVQNPWFKMINV